MNLNEFGQFKEGNRLEMKAAQGRDGNGALPRSIWETLSAFANTSGGVIVLGAEEKEDGTFDVVGIKKPDKVIDDFWNAALSEDKVSARFMQDSHVTREIVDGKEIVAIRVPWADRHIRPVYINDDIFGGTFRRTHTGDHHCTREEVLSMLRDSDTSSQDGKVIDKARMKDLDFDTIRRYRNEFKLTRSESEWNSYDDKEFLQAVGAIDTGEDGELHPTGAGLLMFGKDRWITKEFPHYFLDYRQEAGAVERWADRFTSQPGDWSGNIYDFYGKVYNKLKAALKVPFSLDENMRRVDDTPAHKALREAIANCLTNANYYERRGIVCVWHDDSITIENPGDFRMPVEEAMKPGKSDPRNETMLKIFSFVNIGERAGSGMGTIVNGWKDGGYPEPIYEVEYGPDRTTLTLPLAETVGSSERQLSENEVVAIGLARSNGRVTTRELAEALEKSERTAGNVLKGLAEKGELEWHGKSKRDPLQHYTLA
ncbi:ATP-binding protein [Adlercreutzia sp. ZJ141]|uniref:ATP-binding protein n=1 Tax=Adlercreutzia sp. ZJ141 TaxID=2709406 RepID=UPI0013EA0614|nr:RNA-binding domain-containing protein [Adlercreutzia sp. ZJ141]